MIEQLTDIKNIIATTSLIVGSVIGTYNYVDKNNQHEIDMKQHELDMKQMVGIAEFCNALYKEK